MATVTCSHTVRIVRTVCALHCHKKDVWSPPIMSILLFIIANGITEWPLSSQPSIISHAMRHAPAHCTINSSTTKDRRHTSQSPPAVDDLRHALRERVKPEAKQRRRRRKKKRVRSPNHNVRYDKSATQQRAHGEHKDVLSLRPHTRTHMQLRSKILFV